MILTFHLLKKWLPELNSRRYTAEDFYSIVNRKECDVVEMHLKRKGYYVTNGKEDYIFLKNRLRELAWLQAAFHEMIHLLMHVPCKFLKRRHEREAQVFALIAMFPEHELPQLVLEYDTFDPFTQFLIRKRLKVLQRYGL